jgi:apolipoprotein D and lipocalin family protein
MTPKTLILSLAMALSPIAAVAEVRDQAVPMTVVETVNLPKYLGKWYEIARFPNRFEAGCSDVTAEYSMNSDDTVKVLNTCVKDGVSETAEGEAWVKGPGKLKVTFVPILGSLAAGDYWIIDLKPDYSLAVVGAPTSDFGWILGRKPTLSKADMDRALAALTKNGYDTSKLEMVKQGG